jgi:hypothetical protein
MKKMGHNENIYIYINNNKGRLPTMARRLLDK